MIVAAKRGNLDLLKQLSPQLLQHVNLLAHNRNIDVYRYILSISSLDEICHSYVFHYTVKYYTRCHIQVSSRQIRI